MTDALRELIGTALEVMNGAFLKGADPEAARLEFYHQFRKLWDRGIPVGLGLGHVLLKPDGPFLVIERIAEKGIAGEDLAIISFGAPGASRTGEVRIQFDGTRWRISG